MESWLAVRQKRDGSLIGRTVVLDDFPIHASVRDERGERNTRHIYVRINYRLLGTGIMLDGVLAAKPPAEDDSIIGHTRAQSESKSIVCIDCK